MALSDVKPRQQQIRDWWLENRSNPYFLILSSATWNRNADMVALERWTDMQGRVACFEEGSLLADDRKWAVIEKQLAYPPLWLIKNWNENSARKRSKAMLTQYHEITTKNNVITLTASGIITENIQADSASLYEWLGITGGHRGP